MSVLGDVFWWKERERERELEKCSDGLVTFSPMLSCFQEEEKEIYVHHRFESFWNGEVSMDRKLL